MRAKTTKLFSLGRIRSEQWCCVPAACWARATSGMRQRRTWTPSGRRYSEFSVYVMALLQGVAFDYRSKSTASSMVSCLRQYILRRRARVVCLSCWRVYALKFKGVIDTRLADRSPPPHHVSSALPVLRNPDNVGNAQRLNTVLVPFVYFVPGTTTHTSCYNPNATLCPRPFCACSTNKRPTCLGCSTQGHRTTHGQ